MFGKSILLLAIAAKLIAADKGTLLVREREDLLSKALKAKDKVVLSVLMDRDFSFHLTCGMAVRSFSTEVRRDDWVDDLSHLRIDSYATAISKVNLIHGRRPNSEYKEAEASIASVDLNDSWVIRSSSGSRIEKHFHTTDTWIKRQGTWKLAGRISEPNPNNCADGLKWGGPF